MGVMLLEEKGHSLHCSNSGSKRTVFLAQLCALVLLLICRIFRGCIRANVLLIQANVKTLHYVYVSVLLEWLLDRFTRSVKSKQSNSL